MNITLNSELIEVSRDFTSDQIQRQIDYGNENFMRGLKTSVLKSHGQQLIALSGHKTNRNINNTGFVGMLSKAYSEHIKVEIAPHDMWYVVLTELSKLIKNNSEDCRSLFTTSDKKQAITQFASMDAIELDLEDIYTKLKTRIPSNTDLFFPDLSTMTPNVQKAFYAALCDAVQEYYSYGMFCCGIPAIRLTGNKEDWEKIVNSCIQLTDLFKKIPVISSYLTQVKNIFDKIVKNYHSVDESFWRDIFTQKNVGSGGDLEINGWIQKLFSTEHPFPKIDNYYYTVSVVPYEHLTAKRKFVAVYGAFEHVRTQDNYLKLDYSAIIFEKKD